MLNSGGLNTQFVYNYKNQVSYYIIIQNIKIKLKSVILDIRVDFKNVTWKQPEIEARFNISIKLTLNFENHICVKIIWIFESIKFILIYIIHSIYLKRKTNWNEENLANKII